MPWYLTGLPLLLALAALLFREPLEGSLWAWRTARTRAVAARRRADAHRYLRRTMPRDGRTFDSMERRRQAELLGLWEQLHRPR